MTSIKQLTPCPIFDDKQYKLCDFYEEFSNFDSEYSKYKTIREKSDNNPVLIFKKSKIYFKNKISVCPACNSSKVIKNGHSTRKLIFITFGELKVYIQKYKCKKCGKLYYTDMTSIVNKNNNKTLPVIESVKKLYSIFGDSLYKIQNALKEEHNVNISHKSIENILLNSKYNKTDEYGRYSGHYLFDALWVKNQR